MIDPPRRWLTPFPGRSGCLSLLNNQSRLELRSGTGGRCDEQRPARPNNRHRTAAADAHSNHARTVSERGTGTGSVLNDRKYFWTIAPTPEDDPAFAIHRCLP